MKYTSTLILALIATVATGQDYSFKVLASKGNNEIKTNGAWTPLKTGASLHTGDELKLASNGYIGLVHKKGKPLEVKTPGSYQVAQLESQVSSGSGIVSKYTDFILSNTSPETKKNNLSATGAVDRGEYHAIRIALPEHAGIYHNVAPVGWTGDNIKAPFIVTVMNMFDEELAIYETEQTSIQLDMNDAKFARENAVIVEVKSKTDPNQKSKRHMIKKLGAADHVGIEKSLTDINTVAQEETALNSYILAGFYEQNKLYIDAIGAYEDAIRLAPDVTAYKESYTEFLKRNNLQ
ncbi:hypothetical protein WBG78_12425 [Chryseolinea sp. T2]|uniref:hypothetical protein n=1 Tax=Chryseolinea sp. T2 TaxID=3129255 RepID=UPI00307776ED